MPGPGRRFQKGHSGNPAGRPKQDQAIMELARAYAPRAIKVLAELMNDPKATASVRVMAAERILDRGYGKPLQQNNVLVGVATRSITQLSDAELMEIIENGRRAAALPAPQPAKPPTTEAQVVARSVQSPSVLL